MTVRHRPQAPPPPQRRNPYAVALRRLGQKVKPSVKLYSRKGRSRDRPFEFRAQRNRPSSRDTACAQSIRS